jgi:hypothetical protein
MDDVLVQVILSGLVSYYLIAGWRTSPLPFVWLRRLRAKVEAWRDEQRFLGFLLTCPMCLSLYVCATVWFVIGEVQSASMTLLSVVAAAGISTAVYHITIREE